MDTGFNAKPRDQSSATDEHNPPSNHGGSVVVQKSGELGLPLDAFTISVNFLHQRGLIAQKGLARLLLGLGPMGLRLTSLSAAEAGRLSL
jgi:hypothetical protein